MNTQIKSWLAIATLLASASSQAMVNVSFERDVELLAVNGKALSAFSTAPSKVELDNGPNQLVARVSKLVSYNGEFKKFLTYPVVLTFDISDADIDVSAGRVIIRDDQIKGFDKKPSLKVTMNGRAYTDFHQGLLPRGTGIVRDYERELLTYNVDNGFAVEEKTRPSINYQSATAVTTSSTVAQATESPVSAGNALILLQADFLRLPEQQRATFIKWANQQ
ncbi:DUF2057 family protein [Photobacterium lutimaris]|uniref:DUF2057 domain-containing protein n=1 Tax=Photobacterium lutimaris TaxID=388278 RepID=A0A2T3IUR2_9GAMM|nr:DUF2057 family protein [Photobacterium lutimaris]PSU32122.1 DUF2057 domain-containing protein [Photobacterium lutimaris]TDR73782.1 hypothetical protein DFP78_110153 [Photobacterium lutimaris]